MQLHYFDDTRAFGFWDHDELSQWEGEPNSDKESNGLSAYRCLVNIYLIALRVMSSQVKYFIDQFKATGPYKRNNTNDCNKITNTTLYQNKTKSTCCVKHRIEFKTLLIVYKGLHGKAPTYIQEMMTPSKSKRYSITSNEERVLEVPKLQHDTFGKRAFPVSGPLAWNCLPKKLGYVMKLKHSSEI